MYEWSRVIFAKKSKFHDAGGPHTVVSPFVSLLTPSLFDCERTFFWCIVHDNLGMKILYEVKLKLQNMHDLQSTYLYLGLWRRPNVQVDIGRNRIFHDDLYPAADNALGANDDLAPG